jgi:hypothetical protein
MQITLNWNFSKENMKCSRGQLASKQDDNEVFGTGI